MKKEELKKEFNQILNNGIVHDGKTYFLSEEEKEQYITWMLKDICFMYKISNIKYCYISIKEIVKNENFLGVEIHFHLLFNDGYNEAIYKDYYLIKINN